jgi:hypothetical protein
LKGIFVCDILREKNEDPWKMFAKNDKKQGFETFLKI